MGSDADVGYLEGKRVRSFMLDEEKTKKQLIDELNSLRANLVDAKQQEPGDAISGLEYARGLKWKDFLLGIYEKSFSLADEELYRYVLDEVVCLTNSEIGFLHRVSEDQQSVILTIWNGEALKHCTAVYDTHYPVDQAGNWVDCVRLKRSIVYNDFSQAPNRKGLPAGHNAIQRFMSVPVIEHGKVLIIFGVGNKPENYEDEDVFQTQMVANSLQSILTRRYAEKQLRDNEERLSLTLKATRDGIWDWDLAQGTGYASPGYYSMLGVDPDDGPLNSEAWWRLIHPDDVGKVKQSLNRVTLIQPTDQDDVPAVEFRMQKKTGGWCWILARGRVVAWDEVGHPLRMVGTHTDITERKQAAEALRESEERYRTLFDTANDAILLLDQSLKYVECNAKSLEMIQRSRNELLGHSPLDFCPVLQPDGRESRAAVMAYLNAAEAGHLQKFYWQSARKDGSMLDMDVSVNAVTLGGRKYLQVIARDITEQRKAEGILKANEALRNHLFESSVLPIIVMDPITYRFIDCNAAAIAIYSFASIEEVLGRTPLDFSAPVQYDGTPSPEKARHFINRALDDDFVVFEWLHQRFDGTQWDAEVHLKRFNSGNDILLQFTLIDITERKRAEEALRESEGKFKDLVEEAIVGVYLIQDDRIKYVNAKFAEIFGYGIDELTDKMSLQDIIFPDDMPLVQENIRKRISGEVKSIHYSFRILAKNGELRDVEVYSSITHYQGKPALIGMMLDVSEKIRTEDALRQNEATLRSIFNATSVGICIMKDRKFQSANKAWYGLFGYSESDIIGQSTWLLYENEEEYERVGRELYANLGNCGLASVQTRLRRKDGTFRDAVVIATPLQQEDISQGAVVTIEDITDRKRAEEELKYHNTLLSIQQEASIDGLLVVDEAGRMLSFNRRFVEMWRIPAEVTALKADELALQAVLDRLAYPEGFLENMRHLYAHAEETSHNEILLKDGRTFDRYTAPVTDNDGRYYGRIWQFRDITEWKQAEETIRASERRLNDVIEFLPDATLVIDWDGQVLAWNRAMETMTGVKKEDMLGKGDYEYALPFYGVRRPILIDLALRQDELTEKQYTAIRRFDDMLFGEAYTPNLPPGDIHLSATASVLRDSDGNIIAAIECIRDITERSRLESQLRQAQKMEAIGTLAGGIAHDFNNILASMFGYTELAMMNQDRADLQSGYLEQVMKASERAKNLVNQILVFSRQREQEKKPVDVRIIAKEALKLLRASLPSTIKMDQQISSVPATVMADPTQIHQIMMNLCTNAAHAMRENGGVLEVSISNLIVSDAMRVINQGFKPGLYVHLMVRDSGHGIEAAIIDKIFDPFFTTKRHQEGTGLGLSVVYGIVKSYDGVIQVKSDLGQGTTFHVYIPAIEEVKETEVRKAEPVVPRGTESILLVDDEEPLVLAMAQYLENMGYDAVFVTASSDALAMVTENPQRFDLVVTDMTMPQMTGMKLSQKILSLNPNIPIILCTGYNETITEDEAKQNGIREFVLKPIQLQKMARLVRQVLDIP
jgi:PAS domain S-box-containing protein